jgi:hypothetical protein
MKKDCTKDPLLSFLQSCVLPQEEEPNFIVLSEEDPTLEVLFFCCPQYRALSKVVGLPSGKDTTLKSPFLQIQYRRGANKPIKSLLRQFTSL